MLEKTSDSWLHDKKNNNGNQQRKNPQRLGQGKGKKKLLVQQGGRAGIAPDGVVIGAKNHAKANPHADDRQKGKRGGDQFCGLKFHVFFLFIPVWLRVRSIGRDPTHSVRDFNRIFQINAGQDRKDIRLKKRDQKLKRNHGRIKQHRPQSAHKPEDAKSPDQGNTEARKYL